MRLLYPQEVFQGTKPRISVMDHSIRTLLSWPVLLLVVVFTSEQESTKPSHSGMQQDTIWYALEEAQQRASTSGNKVLLFFEADWCGTCRQMKRTVFPDKQIRELLSNFYPVQINVDSREPIHFNGELMNQRQLARSLSIPGTPTFLFVDTDGEVVAHYIGFASAERFAALLRFVLSDLFEEISFDDFLNRR